MYVLQKVCKYPKNVYCKLQIKNIKIIHALMFKVLNSIYIFESTNKFIYEHICIDLWF